MAENFTYSQGLVTSITNKSWYVNPAGIEGKEVVLLKRVGDRGSRFYCSLKPGQTLRFDERLFSTYEALEVDMRQGRMFQISGNFPTRDRGRKVSVNVNVRYHVTSAEFLVLKVADPLGELRDKVVAALNRDLASYPEGQINASLIEKIVRNVGPVPHLGLAIDDADVMGFEQDSGVTEHVKRMGQTRADIEFQELKQSADLTSKEKQQKAELLARQLQNDADILMRRARHDNISLTDINVLMHEHPDLINQIFSHFASRDQAVLQSQITLMAPVIAAYIDQKKEDGGTIDPDEIAKIIQRTITTSKGQLQGPLPPPKQIAWGSEEPNILPSEKKPIEFESDDKNNKSDDSDDNDGRIKFG